jgi:outer membrane lipoprotein SlyB
VGEVGVHLHHVARAAVERVAEAREVRRADAVLLGAVEHLQVVVLARPAVGDLAGAVGRAVVDDEDAKAVGGGAGQHLAAAATIASTFSASL